VSELSSFCIFFEDENMDLREFFSGFRRKHIKNNFDLYFSDFFILVFCCWKWLFCLQVVTVVAMPRDIYT